MPALQADIWKETAALLYFWGRTELARDGKPKSIQDQTQYCDRCGISFLWSAEERRRSQNTAAPPLCPGCRQLLPADDRERGLVRWFNHRRYYGFIIRYDEPDIFVHGSQIEDRNRIRPGDLVEFTVVDSERGPTANAVQVISHVEINIL